MIQSVWRFSHLFLASISVFFLIGASISGAILSFSAIQKENEKTHYADLSEITVAQLCDSIAAKYKETFSLEMKQGVIEASVLTMKGLAETVYVNPYNAERVTKPKTESNIFRITRIFHRSLLLKKTGRIMVGISSLLLFFIAVTGVILLARRQGGVLNIFRKLSKDDFYTYWHAQISRIFLVAIVLIALTGVYLSLERFDVLPGEQRAVHTFSSDNGAESTSMKAGEINLFKALTLDEFHKLTFPFSPFPEDGDHFQIKTTNSDLLIDQFTGETLSEFNFEFQQRFQLWSYAIHTGEGSVTWSIVLCMACCSILFFIFSGLQISLKRLKYRKVNTFKKSKSEFIILVGSENGNTMRYARSVYDLLISNGRSVYLDYLNNYKPKSHMHKLLVITSTYGLGEAPSNAGKFLKKLMKDKEEAPFEYSVLGFGSRNYPEFCKFAIDVNAALNSLDHAICQTELHLVNQQSKSEFEFWKNTWCESNGIKRTELNVKDDFKYTNFKIQEITDSNLHPKDTFRLSLTSAGNRSFISGDLLAVKANNDSQERLYSIGKGADGNIVLYIKKHHFGLCSRYLSSQVIGGHIQARIVLNKNFHAPKKFKSMILISNGAGIAPFIGMAHENKCKREIYLFWGGKSQEDYLLYEEELNTLKEDGKIKAIRNIFSEDKSRYVQELIPLCPKLISKGLETDSLIMICGSIAMGQAVLAEIDGVCLTQGLREVAFYQESGQIKLDCY